MLDRSPKIPPLPLVAGAAASDGSPMSGYVPAAGPSPMGAAIGTSPGLGRPAALEIGDASAGSRVGEVVSAVGGVVKPPGVAGSVPSDGTPAGLVRAGVSAGLVSASGDSVADADGRPTP